MVNTYDRGQHIQAILSKDCTKVKVRTLMSRKLEKDKIEAFVLPGPGW